MCAGDARRGTNYAELTHSRRFERSAGALLAELLSRRKLLNPRERLPCVAIDVQARYSRDLRFYERSKTRRDGSFKVSCYFH